MLCTLLLVLCLPSVGWAEEQVRTVALKYIEAEAAVEQAQAALGNEITKVTIVADARSNRVYLLHENPKVTKLLEQFLQAIDLPGEPVGMTFVTLNYIAASAALDAAHKAFGEQLEGARAVLCEKTNRILIGGTDLGRRKLESFLVALDRQPRQIRVRTVITKVTKDDDGRGLRTALSQPTIIIQDGEQGVIMTGSDGESLGSGVTASVIEEARGARRGD